MPVVTFTELIARQPDSFVTEAEVAAATGVTIVTLRCWASRRIGPARTKLGKQILYRVKSLNEWAAAKERKSHAA